MTTDEKWEFIVALDDELLLGGAIVSEWSAFLVRNADLAFCAHANLAAILAAQAAMESHLKYERCSLPEQRRMGFFDLIEHADLTKELRDELHSLRRYRNKWIHVSDPQDDADLLERPEATENELEAMAMLAIRLMRRVIYLDQFV